MPTPCLGVKPPKLDVKVTEALSDEQLKRLIGACNGKAPIDPRDEAIVRVMCETGLRAGEVIGMQRIVLWLTPNSFKAGICVQSAVSLASGATRGGKT